MKKLSVIMAIVSAIMLANCEKAGLNNQHESTLPYRPVTMVGGPSDGGEGHAWVCDGAKETYSVSGYFIEFYVRGEYTSLEFAPSIENSVNVSSPSTYHFHHNWGLSANSEPNGWYLEDDVSTAIGNFTYDRTDIYVSKP